MKSSAFDQGLSTTLTKDNIKEYPKRIQQAFKAMEAREEGQYLTPKYYDSLKLWNSSKIVVLFNENPNRPLKDVVATIIGELPEFIPADKILELTAFTIEKWQKLTEKESAEVV